MCQNVQIYGSESRKWHFEGSHSQQLQSRLAAPDHCCVVTAMFQAINHIYKAYGNNRVVSVNICITGIECLSISIDKVQNILAFEHNAQNWRVEYSKQLNSYI